MSSCKKEQLVDDPISTSTFGPDCILQKRQTAFHIGIALYRSQGKYKGSEEISLNVAGVTAKLLKRYVDNERIMMLFEVPGINITGDHKLIFNYSIGASKSSVKRTVRVVNDFLPASIWPKLDDVYVRSHNFLISVYQSYDFDFNPPASISLGNSMKTGYALDIGEYRTNFYSSPKVYVGKEFIPGLNGVYQTYYENGLLKEINVMIADTFRDPFFSITELKNELIKLYGSPTQSGGKTIYRSGNFDIAFDDYYYRYITATVTKAR